MPPPPQPLPDDLIPEILLRLPPDDPARLVRAAAVCKAWRGVLADPAFPVRYRAFHHRTRPPILGFLHNPSDDDDREQHYSRFVPTTPSSFRPPGADRRDRHVLDCRHGRAVLYDYDFDSPTQGYVVWDLITGDHHRIPNVLDSFSNAAVLCAAGEGGCSGGPFVVAFAGVEHGYYGACDAEASFYSSETGEWGIHINIHLAYRRYALVNDRPGALVGDSLYFVGQSGTLLRYRHDLLLRLGHNNILSAGIRDTDVLSVIKPPDAKHLGDVVAVKTEDDGLGLASLYRHRLSLWARETGSGGRQAGWVQRRVVDLKTLLRPVANPKRRPRLSGVAEGANIIFVSTEDGVFTIELESLRARKVCEMGSKVDRVFPFVSFYNESFLLRLASNKLPAPVGNR